MADADRKGYVYLIVNDQIMGRVKIGYTMREPIDRAYELVSTGTTGTFVVIYQALVVNPRDVETEVHRRLASHNRGLEWFEVCPNLAKQAILSCVDAVLYEETVAKWHPSQPEPHSWARTVLQEARIAAEEVARKQEEAEEEARRLAEEERIRKAKVDEEARKQAELAEHQRLAEEAARAAAEAEREEERKRREAIEAETRRQRDERLNQIVLRTCGVIAAAFVIGAWVYAVAGPYSQAEITRRQTSVEKAEEQADLFEADLARNRWEAARLDSLLNELPAARAKRNSDLESARAAVVNAEDKLRKKQEWLRELAIVGPRDLRRSDELWGGAAAMDELRKQLRDAKDMVRKATVAIDALSEDERRVKDLLRRANTSVAEVEKRVTQQMQAVKSVQRHLSDALRHNKQWTW